jgi:hypothetical protein
MIIENSHLKIFVRFHQIDGSLNYKHFKFFLIKMVNSKRDKEKKFRACCCVLRDLVAGFFATKGQYKKPKG